MDYYAVKNDRADDELQHYGVIGMKWGVRKSRRYERSANKHTKKAEKLQDKANAKRRSLSNTASRRIKYATKEQRYASAEKFHNQKALGLSYVSKLFGTTLDYKYNKSRAAKDAVMKEKYSQAKSGTTNRVNRLEYKAEQERIKANKAILKKKVTDLKVNGASRDTIHKMLNSSLGDTIVSETWVLESTYKDRTAKTETGRKGYVRE